LPANQALFNKIVGEIFTFFLRKWGMTGKGRALIYRLVYGPQPTGVTLQVMPRYAQCVLKIKINGSKFIRLYDVRPVMEALGR
jgi:hypothetical protein